MTGHTPIENLTHKSDIVQIYGWYDITDKPAICQIPAHKPRFDTLDVDSMGRIDTGEIIIGDWFYSYEDAKETLVEYHKQNLQKATDRFIKVMGMDNPTVQDKMYI